MRWRTPALGALFVVVFAATTRAEGAVSPPFEEDAATAPVDPAATAPAVPVAPAVIAPPATQGASPSAPVWPSPAPLNVESATAPASSADLAALRETMRRDEAAIAALERQLDAEREDASFRARLSGYVQIDWVVHDQASQNQIDFSTGLPLNQDRFTLRRGHLRVDAERGIVSGVLEVDANTTSGPQVRPIDAEVSARWPEKPNREQPSLLLSAGLMKIPFGFEVPELDFVRPFLERSTVMRALFPGEFDLGARVRVAYREFDLTLAAMNGSPIGDRVFPALAPDRTKEIVGHLGAKVEIVPRAILEAGISADTGTGFHEGTPTTKDQVVWRDDNGDGIVQATEVQIIAGSSATPSQTFHRFAIGGDVRLTLEFAPGAALALRAELVRAENLDRAVSIADPVGAGYSLRELGYYVGATQEVTKWALVGVRYDHYDPDQDAREQEAVRVVPFNQSYGTLALLAMLRYDTARLSVEYDKNWNSLGRDASGAPATLQSDAVTVRGQVTF